MGVPEPGPGFAGVTVAVKVTGWPKTDGFGGRRQSRVGRIGKCTICEMLCDEPAVKSASPEYWTESEWVAADRLGSVIDAVPPARVAVPITVVPS